MSQNRPSPEFQFICKSEKTKRKNKSSKEMEGLWRVEVDLSSFGGLSQNCQTGRKGSISPFRWHLHPIGSNEIFKRRSGVTSQHRQASGFWKLRTVTVFLRPWISRKQNTESHIFLVVQRMLNCKCLRNQLWKNISNKCQEISSTTITPLSVEQSINMIYVSFMYHKVFHSLPCIK